MSVYMFPGQGSQHRGMGEGLFERFSSEVEIANSILGYSIEELCLFDLDDVLSKTQYTQPALFTVNALHYFEARQNGCSPQYFIGHSLGEYNALHAAGVIDFASGLKLTMHRGRLMSKACKGRMAAVMGVDENQVNKMLRNSGLDQVYIANLNTPTQIVISGAEAQLEKALDLLEANLGAVCVQLQVSGAFHSPLMESARIEFEVQLASVVFHEPSVPVISNVTARPYSRENIGSGLSQQITSPVNWIGTIRYLKSMGENDFSEIGPGGVLTRLASRIGDA